MTTRQATSAADRPARADAYPVLPLRDIVVFPHMIVPLFVGREKSINALEEVMRADKLILLATQKNAARRRSGDRRRSTSVGTLATVLQLLKLPDGTVKVLVEGVAAAPRSCSYTDRADYYEADAVVLAESVGEQVEAEALARSVVTEFESYVKLNKKVSPEVVGVGPADRGLRQARRHGRLASRRQDPGQAGDPGDCRRSPSGWRRCSA